MPEENNGAPASFELPGNLNELADDALAALIKQAEDEGKAIVKKGDASKESIARAGQVADALDAVRGEKSRRDQERAEDAAKFQEITARFAPSDEAEAAPADGEAAPALEGELVDAGAPATAASRPTGGTIAVARDFGGVSGAPRINNPSLTAARAVAPKVDAPRSQLTITASAELPGRFGAGAPVPDLAALGELMEQRARGLSVVKSNRSKDTDPYGGVNVARIYRDDLVDRFGEGATQRAVQAYADKLREARRPQQMATMVAAGGWCAPNEVRYDFYNIACAGGQLDLPTFGMPRGGVTWPISPSLADSFSPAVLPNNATVLTVPWIWTEANDIIAATGGAGLTIKPCIRVPCSTMDAVRAECYGVCVTAGNLADAAWPESTRNFLQLLEVAYSHVQNWRNIQLVRNQTTAMEAVACSGTAVGATSSLLDLVEMAAIDYRKRFYMCRDDVMEAVFPDWGVGPIRADLSKRTGIDLLRVTDEMIASYFDARHVRVQWVDDYQARGTGQPGVAAGITSWPDTIEFLIYPPGTYALGTTMTLDLGVVRDSTLNATNDHTAAWYETCSNVAKFGHLGRRYTASICPSGVTGAANITSCCP